MAFSFSDLLLLPLHQLASRLAFRTLHMGSDNVSTFHVIVLDRQLRLNSRDSQRRTSTPMGRKKSRADS